MVRWTLDWFVLLEPKSTSMPSRVCSPHAAGSKRVFVEPLAFPDNVKWAKFGLRINLCTLQWFHSFLSVLPIGTCAQEIVYEHVVRQFKLSVYWLNPNHPVGYYTYFDWSSYKLYTFNDIIIWDFSFKLHSGVRSERNLIHANLSLSIGIFQIIFLAGIEATSNEVC